MCRFCEEAKRLYGALPTRRVAKVVLRVHLLFLKLMGEELLCQGATPELDRFEEELSEIGRKASGASAISKVSDLLDKWDA